MPVELSPEEIDAKLMEFKPVEDTSQTEFIDINQIKAERPSTYGLKNHSRGTT